MRETSRLLAKKKEEWSGDAAGAALRVLGLHRFAIAPRILATGESGDNRAGGSAVC
jgi:hypothetical protein